MKKYILMTLLYVMCGCDNDDSTSDKFDKNATFEASHGIFDIGYTYIGSSLERTLIEEPGCNHHVIFANEDGTATLHTICEHKTCDTTTVMINFITDGQSITVQNMGSETTYRFGMYHFYNPIKEVDEHEYIAYTIFNTPKGKKMYKYYRIQEVRNDSTAKMLGDFKVPKDRVWREKNIVGYFNDTQDYYHFRNDGTVTKKNRFGAEKTRKEGNYKLWHNGKNDRITMTFGETNETIEASVVFDENFFLFYEDDENECREFDRTKVNDEVK